MVSKEIQNGKGGKRRFLVLMSTVLSSFVLTRNLVGCQTTDASSNSIVGTTVGINTEKDRAGLTIVQDKNSTKNRAEEIIHQLKGTGTELKDHKLDINTFNKYNDWNKTEMECTPETGSAWDNCLRATMNIEKDKITTFLGFILNCVPKESGGHKCGCLPDTEPLKGFVENRVVCLKKNLKENEECISPVVS